MTVVLAVTMSYFSPERALGVPQREGERSRGRTDGRTGGGGVMMRMGTRRRGGENLSVMLEKG